MTNIERTTAMTLAYEEACKYLALTEEVNDEAYKSARKAVRDYNKAVQKAHLEAYRNMYEADGANAVVADYLADMYCEGLKLNYSSKTGLATLDTVPLKVQYADLVSIVPGKLSAYGGYRRYLKAFAYNVTAFYAKDGDDEKQHVLQALNPTTDKLVIKARTEGVIIDGDKTIRWNDHSSKNVLAIQYNALVAMMLPAGMKCPMPKKAIHDFYTAVNNLDKSGDMEHEAMSFTMESGTAKLETLVLRAVYTVMTKRAIVHTTTKEPKETPVTIEAPFVLNTPKETPKETA